MPSPTRQQRLASLLHREIATAVRGLDDPRLGLVTITRVDISNDLQMVTAHWTVLGEMRERRLAEHALESARSFVRGRYTPAVRTRLVPELRFAFDDREAKRAHMQGLIEIARRTDSDHGQQPEPPAPDPTEAPGRMVPPGPPPTATP